MRSLVTRLERIERAAPADAGDGVDYRQLLIDRINRQAEHNPRPLVEMSAEESAASVAAALRLFRAHMAEQAAERTRWPLWRR